MAMTKSSANPAMRAPGAKPKANILAIISASAEWGCHFHHSARRATTGVAKTTTSGRNNIGDPATIIVTDTNRKRARRWGTLRENVGYTERAAEDWVLALEANGAALGVGDRGPLWLLFDTGGTAVEDDGTNKWVYSIFTIKVE